MNYIFVDEIKNR